MICLGGYILQIEHMKNSIGRLSDFFHGLQAEALVYPSEQLCIKVPYLPIIHLSMICFSFSNRGGFLVIFYFQQIYDSYLLRRRFSTVEAGIE